MAGTHIAGPRLLGQMSTFVSSKSSFASGAALVIHSEELGGRVGEYALVELPSECASAIGRTPSCGADLSDTQEAESSVPPFGFFEAALECTRGKSSKVWHRD